jgi:hypothetical protein
MTNRVLQEPECDVLEEEEEDDDDDPIFVLTDEWKEFFARSEARRKLGSVFSFATFCLLRTILYVIFLLFIVSFLLCVEKQQGKKKEKH